MTPRIVGLIGAELLLIAGGAWVIDQRSLSIASPGLIGTAVFVAALVGLSQLPRMYIEHRRHNVWITPADGAILVGLFTLGPVATVGAAMLAEAIISVRLRQRPVKLLFNLVSMLGGYTAAAATFATIGRTDPLDPWAWAAGLLALAACAVWDVVSTAALFAVLEARPFRAMVNGLGPAGLASLLLSTALGLTAAVLVDAHVLGVLLVVPVLAILVISTRAVNRSQSERSRLERLYAASAHLARLNDRAETLVGIAEEANALVTGAAAICATSRDQGPWEAVLVDDDGARSLSGAAVARVIAATGRHDQGAIELEGRRLAAELPDLPNLVWATSQADGDIRVLIAVLSELPADEQGEHRADVMATFAAHAASVVANVELHQDVQDALERQLQLNRQKSEFVAAVSHELRTPLASVIGAIQTVQRAGDRLTAAQQVDVLELGATQGARLRSLIEDLLLVAAAEHQAVRVEQDTIDPVVLLDETVAELNPEGQERVQVQVGPVGAFLSDEDKVRRILINLIDNARKYAATGPIEVGVQRAGGIISFTVDDHGQGIRVEDRERVFERFVQLDGSSTRRQGGTGLGLHLSRELAELLGGTLTVGEAPTGGARFALALPQRRGRDVVEAVTAPVSAGAKVQLPVSTAPTIRRSPLRRPVGAGVPGDVGVGA